MSSTVATPPVTDDAFLMQGPDDVESDAGNRRKLIFAGGAAALVLLGGGYYFLSSGGSGTSAGGTNFTLPARHVHPAAVPAPIKLPPTTSQSIGRDPFKPLVVPAAAAPAATTSGTTTTTTSTTPTTTSSTPTSPTVVVPATSTGSSAPTMTASSVPTSITLTKVTASALTFHVVYSGGTHDFTVGVPSSSQSKFGSAVAGMPEYFALENVVDSSDAVVQEGDATPFQLHVGQVHVLN